MTADRAPIGSRAEDLTAPLCSISRYYSARYVLKEETPGVYGDSYVHFHKNGIAVLGIAPSHSIITTGQTATAVSWSPAALSAASTVLSGKRKHGSSSIAAGDLLCTVSTDAALSFRLTAGVGGRLLEVNERLITAPSLLSDPQSSQWEGYVAVVLMDKKQQAELHAAATQAASASASSASTSSSGGSQQQQPQPVWRSTAEWEQIRGRVSSTGALALSQPSAASASSVLS